jgi:hypothetical protein
LYETIGFVALSLLPWLDEILDVPHYLMGAPRTPINIVECVLESGFVLVLGLAVLLATRELLARIGYLEGILSICGYCKKIRTPDGWVQFETYVDAHSEARFSHTICPACLEEHRAELFDE